MADKRCANGHFIDESWDLCPYCPREHRAAAVPSPSRPTPATAIAHPDARAMRHDSPPPEINRTVAAAKADPALAGMTNRYAVGWLVGLTGTQRGESFTIRNGRNVLGRDRRSDIVITDDQASAHHADLVYRPDERRFILMDHNSTNGTFVNGVELEPRRDLAPYDIVKIGTHQYLFVPLCSEEMYWDGKGQLK